MRRQTDPDVLAAIEELALTGWRPPAIEEQLAPRFGERLPSRRTLYSIVGDLQPKNGPGWSLAEADPDEAALVLPVLAAVTLRSAGRLGGFTVELAAWIVRVRRAAPKLSPFDAFRWAVRYGTAAPRGDTRELDLRLALYITTGTEKPPPPGVT